MSKISFAGHTISLPASRLARAVIGVLLIIGGVLGALPVLGFWMIPLGFLVLSIDFPPIRRWRRRMTVKLGFWLKNKYPKLAARLGFSELSDSAFRRVNGSDRNTAD